MSGRFRTILSKALSLEATLENPVHTGAIQALKICLAENISSNELENAIIQALEGVMANSLTERARTAFHCGTQDKRKPVKT